LLLADVALVVLVAFDEAEDSSAVVLPVPVLELVFDVGVVPYVGSQVSLKKNKKGVEKTHLQ
jgi:hypothetical protein